MAVLTDILIAPANDVPAIIAQWPGSKRWPALETTGLDWLLLADLAVALEQSALAKKIEELDPTSIGEGSGGPSVYVLPTALRDHIATISPSDLKGVAERWCEGGETKERGLTPQDAERLLMQLQALATRALLERKPLLLWISM